MREPGLEPEPDEEFQYLSDSIPAAPALAGRICGVLFTPALLGGVITAPVPGDPREGDPLTRHALRAVDRRLAEAVDGASSGLQRRAAIAETRRQCGLAGVAGQPVLDEALASAERGETPPAGYDSPLAELIRGYESEMTGHPIDDATGEWMTSPSADPRRSPGDRRNIFSIDTATGIPTCPSCEWHHRPDEEEREAIRPRQQAAVAVAVRHTLSPDAVPRCRPPMPGGPPTTPTSPWSTKVRSWPFLSWCPDQ
ncbi:hypothetical protein Pta02_81410 [Planobispora takensis]|uniref:DUF222 domain-containing protein n=1 Tax=Planobispora takensis TaxID=1367882 RepID=A0A8J3T5L7_9ACTN|nr:hypothetical protein [Planobispora takensis]GII06133.1 hypothetical protein Pta02_81410 [Planobispora takensis]